MLRPVKLEKIVDDALSDPKFAREYVNQQREEISALRSALHDMLAGWKYIREYHGDLYGVGWDRAQQKSVIKARAALAKARGAKEG